MDYLAPALCVMPLSMYWLWSRLTTLHWSRKLVSKLRKQNYQVQAKTRPWQRRHPVTSVIAIFVQLAVEREAVAIRGAGNAQKVPKGGNGKPKVSLIKTHSEDVQSLPLKEQALMRSES